MKFDSQVSAEYAGEILDLLLARAVRDTAEIINQGDIPEAVTYFAELRDMVKTLQDKISALQKHVDTLSHESLPTMFTNANVKTITVDNIGRVTINIRWSASPINKEVAFDWLRSTGNQGLIIETINAQTLGAFAKEQIMAGKPLPSDIFKVGSSPYTSITKG
jgi:hypothetical protein